MTEERRRQASVTWLGVRSTLTANLYETQAQSLLPQLLNPDNEFSSGNVVRWFGYGVNLSHRLTPRSILTLSVNQQRTSESVGSQATNLWTNNLMWSNQIAPRATVSVSGRYTVQGGDTSYNEAALLASLSMQF